MSKIENEWYYDYILETISSPQFRNPIKDFIDNYCISFVGEEENSIEQGILFKKFTKLVEKLLQLSLTELGITEEMFCLAAKKGLEHPIAKKYFEQLISFTNYNYFKSLMTRRNIQLEEMQNSMGDKNVKQKKKKPNNNDRDLQEAIKMSKASEEEIRKLKALEERELIRAIKLSQMYTNPNPVVESYQKKTVPSIVNKQIQQSIPIKPNESNPNKTTNVNTLPNKPIQENKKQEIEKKEIKNQETPKPIKPEIKTPTPIQPKDLIDDDKEDEEKDEEPLIDEDNEEQETVNPIDKVIQKKKKEIPDSNIQYDITKKNVILPQNTNNVRGTLSNTLNKNLNDLETEKVRKLREYREMILNIEREKRKKKEEFENTNNMNDEDKRRLALRMQLADKLKRQNLEKKNEDE